MPHRTPLRMLFPPIPAFPLRDGHAALLVLDYQPFMVDRSVGLGRMAAERGIAREFDEYYEQVEYGLRNTADLAQAFRSVGLPVVFTRLEASPSTGPTSDRYPYCGTLPMPDSSEAQIVSILAPRTGPHGTYIFGGEYVFARSLFLSPFVTTHVDKVLDGYGTRYLVLAGVMTGWAVELTAREAADRGYGVLVASDACPGETYEIHSFVMTQLVGGMIRVRPTSAILEMLAGTRT